MSKPIKVNSLAASRRAVDEARKMSARVMRRKIHLQVEMRILNAKQSAS